MEHINNSGFIGNLSLIVVDNDSTDGSQKMVEQEFPRAKLIKNSSNLGFAAAANQILKTLDTQYVLLLNSDTEVCPGSLETLVNFMESHSDVGAAGPLILNPDGSVQHSCRKFPSFKDATVHAFLGVFLPSNPYSNRYKMVECDHEAEQAVDWVSGAAVCLCVRAMKEIQYFDESYYMYVEDMDLCFRLRQAGWKVYYTPQAKIYHYIGESSKQASKKMIIEHQKSIYRFYSKLYENKPWRYIKFLIGIGLFLRGLILIFLGWVSVKKERANRNGRTGG